MTAGSRKCWSGLLTCAVLAATGCGGSSGSSLFDDGSSGAAGVAGGAGRADGGAGGGGGSSASGGSTGPGGAAGAVATGGVGGAGVGGAGGTAAGSGTGGMGVGGSGGVGGFGGNGVGGSGGTGPGGSGGVGGVGGAGGFGGSGGTGPGGSGGIGGLARPPSSVECDGASCDTTNGGACCITVSTTGMMTSVVASCSPQGSCPFPSTAARCDGPEDCPGGVCCATFTVLVGIRVFERLECRNSFDCAGMNETPVCDPAAADPCGGGTCGPELVLPPSYSVCH